MYLEIILVLIGLISIIYSWIKSDMRCPPPTIIYKLVPKHALDVQFGDENYPSDIYLDMFNQNNPWIGGYTLGDGKTYTQEQAAALTQERVKQQTIQS